MPFRADSDFALMRAHLEQAPEPVRTLAPSLPDWLEKAIERSLAKDPGERFETAADFAAELRRGLAKTDVTAAEPARALPAGPPPPLPRSTLPAAAVTAATTTVTSPRRRLMPVAALGLVAIVSAVLVFMLPRSEPDAGPTAVAAAPPASPQEEPTAAEETPPPPPPPEPATPDLDPDELLLEVTDLADRLPPASERLRDYYSDYRDGIAGGDETPKPEDELLTERLDAFLESTEQLRRSANVVAEREGLTRRRGFKRFAAKVRSKLSSADRDTMWTRVDQVLEKGQPVRDLLERANSDEPTHVMWRQIEEDLAQLRRLKRARG